MRFASSRRGFFSVTPIALLAAQSILTCSPASYSFAALAVSVPGLSSQARQHFNQATIDKMSNGEGYVDELSPRASQLIQDSIEIFSANPSHEIFRRSWAPDGVFEDPLCYAQGAAQYKAQFWGLLSAFSKCELLAWHATKDEEKQVNYVQRQRYTFRGLGVSKEIISTISMKLNDEGKIVLMQDRWNHNDPPANFIAWPLRRLNAITLPYLISVPPETGSKPSRTEL